MLIHFKPHQSIWNQRLSMTRLRNRCHQRVAFRHGARTTPHLRKRPNGGCWQVIELNDWGTLKPETHQKQTPIFHRNYHDFNWFQISGEDFPSNPLICWSWARGNLFHVPIFFWFLLPFKGLWGNQDQVSWRYQDPSDCKTIQGFRYPIAYINVCPWWIR